MQEQIEVRLADLKEQLQKGQTQLQELQGQEAYLRETMLRISGAIQVLEELLAGDKAKKGEQEPSSSSMHVP
jgi:prefoldin subunit 5